MEMKKLILIFKILFSINNIFIFCYDEKGIEQLLLLSPRISGMGFASTGVCNTSDFIRINPSCLYNSSKTLISHSRSIRHFPFGGKSKFYIGHSKKFGNLPDQLNVDLISVITKSKKNFSYAFGWTIPGEFGYDYGNEALKEIIPEREKVQGGNKIISVSDTGKNNNNGVLNGISFSNTKYYYRINKNDKSVLTNFTTNKFHLHHSEIKNNNFIWGAGISFLMSDFKRVKAIKLTLGFAYTGLENTLFSLDVEKEFSKNGGRKPIFHTGVEVTTKSKYLLRMGYFGEKIITGNLTYGLGIKSGMLNLDYAVVKDYLPQLVGQPIKTFKDVHIIGYSLRF